MNRSEAAKIGYHLAIKKHKAIHLKRRKEAQDRFYKLNKKCPYCGGSIPFEKRKNKFCSHSCSSSFHNTGKVRNFKGEKNHYCKNCSKKLKKIQSYCSLKCQGEFQVKEYIRRWLNHEIPGGKNYLSDTIRIYLFRIHSNKCEKCGWGEINEHTNKVPLEVNHKNGNPLDHSPNNLELLCPNCHSLTRSHKGANVGNGRQKRREDRQRMKKEKGFMC